MGHYWLIKLSVLLAQRRLSCFWLLFIELYPGDDAQYASECIATRLDRAG